MYKDTLEKLYAKYGVEDRFKSDYEYLTNAIKSIDDLWWMNIKKISKPQLVILAEAPLWGKEKGKEKYFYNTKSDQSQFFYASDLKDIYSDYIKNKSELIDVVNDLGIIIIDVSPFPFNPATTALSYRKDDAGISKTLKRKDYREIIKCSFKSHIKPKIEQLNLLIDKNDKLKYVYRYTRVKKLHKTIAAAFQNSNFDFEENIELISQSGGGINRGILKDLVYTT